MQIYVDLKKDKMDYEKLRKWYCEIPKETYLRPTKLGQDVVNPTTFERYDTISFNSHEAFLLFYVRYKDENVIKSVLFDRFEK